MGLLGWVKKLKSIVSDISEQKVVSEVLRRTLKKAKKYEGDPFYEYRKKKIPPEQFEYGMNCFLNRIFEMSGEEVAQKTYEELKNEPGTCKILESTSETDLLGIPVLFGAGSLQTVINAQNRAVERIKIEGE
ncbi:hypothetical protein KAW50_05865 [candidate division WOR-3 bacterium]|nr:hypothetical protein [candidate division WOR-3 bacterium]